jgi:hypothetical protein
MTNINAPPAAPALFTVSVFKSAVEKEPAQNASLAHIIKDIRSSAWLARNVKTLRADRAKDEKLYQENKKKLPAVTLSGTCSDRKTMVAHSGLIQADLDKLDGGLPAIRARAMRDPHIGAGFISPSGSGLKLAVRIPPVPDRHSESFDAVDRYIRETYGGARIDPRARTR